MLKKITLAQGVFAALASALLLAAPLGHASTDVADLPKLAKDTLKIEKAYATPSSEDTTFSVAYMQLTATEDLKITEAHSMIAEQTVLSNNYLDGETMKARVTPAIHLPAGENTALAYGNNNIALLNLLAPLPEGSEIPLTLVVEGADGQKKAVHLRLPITKKWKEKK